MLAGKYAGAIRKKAGEISRDPVQSAAAAGAAGAGLATLGNVVTGESENEGLGRTALEALGAGAAAAAAGAGVPQLRKYMAKEMPGKIQAGVDRAVGAAVKSDMFPQVTMATPKGRKVIADANQVAENVGNMASAAAIPLTALGVTSAAGLGGLVGGGAGNVGAMLGVPGIDPEAPGSSNTVNSRLTMQGMGSQYIS